MGIASAHELARTWENEIGIPQRAVRRWAVVLEDNTLQNNPLTETELLTYLGLDGFGNAHPTLDHLGLRKITLTERFGDSPYHVEAVAEYGVITDNEYLNPEQRKADWTFEAQQGQVPALFYYNGSGNGDKRPLVNAAYDFFEGLTTEESLVRFTVTKNFWPFPEEYLQLNNYVNSDEYMGCAAGTLKCIGVSSDYTKEFWSGIFYQFWATKIIVQYRESGWALQLPNVGWNYLGDGQKRRAMVFDFENGEWVASPNPVPLTSQGELLLGSAPDILLRRVNPEANFRNLLGKPPTEGTWPIGSL